MIDVILDTLIDALKLLPFLFVAFLLIEVIEHKFSNKAKKIVSASGNFGPLIGSVLGVIPQCGFSVMATNLYITRIVSLGTLISIYLSTSDEMLPILISQNVEAKLIISILLIKVFIGITSGFIIDFILRKKKQEIVNYEICDEVHCHCEKGIFVSSIKHTLNTILFIVIISFLINVLFAYAGEEFLSTLFLKGSVFGPFVTCLIGLIPNCGASVMITELYLNGAVSFGSLIGGLLTGSGVAILVLFKSNKNLRENIKILLITYGIGLISGIIIELIGILF